MKKHQLSGYSRRAAGMMVLIALALPASAQIHDRERREIAPGVTHTVFHVEGPNIVHVLEVDLKNPVYRLESYRPPRLVRTSDQVKANAERGKDVLGAVNADFFSFKTQWPFGNQVVDGQFVHGGESPRSHVAVDDEGRLFLDRFTFEGWFQTPARTIYPIHGVNDRHVNNAIVLHTSYSDSTTSFGGPGTTFGLKLLSPRWIAGDTLLMVVHAVDLDETATISSREAVLWVGSGPGVLAARTGITNGDTLLVYLGFSPRADRIEHSVGGGGRILENGVPVSDSTNARERIGVVFLKSRHPRTFVAMNRDTTLLYLCTVDGRQPASVGMSFDEMAQFLLHIGAWDAVNLDGGGSTAMVVEGRVVNSPSDKTGERAVANTLQVVRRGGER